MEDRSHRLEEVEDILADVGPLVGSRQDDEEARDDGDGLWQVDLLVKVDEVLFVVGLALLGGDVGEGLADDGERVKVLRRHDDLEEVGPEDALHRGDRRRQEGQNVVAHRAQLQRRHRVRLALVGLVEAIVLFLGDRALPDNELDEHRPALEREVLARRHRDDRLRKGLANLVVGLGQQRAQTRHDEALLVGQVGV